MEFCIGGHYHLDYESASDTGIPVILAEADTIHDRGGSMPEHGTTDEAAVSAVIADYNAKKISIIRIGRGENREIEVSTTIVSYTNVIPLSIGADGEIFNSGKGWAAESRIGSSGIYLGGNSDYVTGHIKIDPTRNNTIYLKNVTFDSANSNHGLATFDSAFVRTGIGTSGSNSWVAYSDLATGAYSCKPVLDGTNVIEFTLTTEYFLNEKIQYIAFCAGYIGDDSIITINEPIG